MVANRLQRIFIADPSLQDWIGHHAPYDFSVQKEAISRGLTCEILANKAFDFGETGLDGIVPVFSHTAWGKKTSDSRSFLKRDYSFYLAARIILSAYDVSNGLYQRCRKACVTLIDPISASGSPATPETPFNAVPDNAASATSTDGPTLLERMRRLKRHVAAFARAGRIYRLISDTFGNYPLPGFACWLASLRAVENYYEIRRYLVGKGFGAGDLLFAHMVTGYGFGVWALISKWAAGQGGDVVILMRYPIGFIPLNDICNRVACRAYEQLFTDGKLRLATDSDLLATEYARYLAVPMEVFPIPHVKRDSGPTAGPDGPLKCVSLGNARAEKGIVEILDAIRLLEKSGEIEQFRFELQINDPDPECIQQITAFLAESHMSVTTRDEPLSGPEYEQLLAMADVVLLPYWSSIYDSRTSGVLVEAIASSKPIITTEDTWLAREATGLGTGLLVESRNPASIAAALIEVRKNYSEYSRLAGKAAVRCREQHNPERFIAALLRQASPEARHGNRKVLIAYPFPNLYDGKSGNSVRVRYLIDFLLQHGYQPSVLAVDQIVESATAHLDGISITTYPQNRPLHLGRALWLVISWIGHQIGHWHQVWIVSMFSRHEHDRPFKLALNQALIGQSAVFVEYAFDVRPIEPLARALRIPLVVTAHDRHSAIGSCRLLARRIEALEVDSLRRANYVATVSPIEQDWFRDRNVDNCCISNPCDVHKVSEPSDGSIRMDAGLDWLLGSRYFLFLGSAYSPNFLAKEQLKHLAGEVERRGLPWKIVVVGSCVTVSETNNQFIALGLVDDDVRTYLYRHCEMVLSPLPFGTGSSLKTIEAMAMRVPVMGSSATFRGLPVSNEVECFIEDNIDNYLDRIARVIDDAELKASIVRKAYQLALRYDYRVAYQPYLRFLEEPA